MATETIRCERHGERRATFVCQHLLNGTDKGWITVESGDPKRPDAICARCDAAWHAAGGEFTDAIRELIRIRVVCASCYDELRERHLTG
jgi:hypothetical protein